LRELVKDKSFKRKKKEIVIDMGWDGMGWIQVLTSGGVEVRWIRFLKYRKLTSQSQGRNANPA
jgi:hypothetical protein